MDGDRRFGGVNVADPRTQRIATRFVAVLVFCLVGGISGCSRVCDPGVVQRCPCGASLALDVSLGSAGAGLSADVQGIQTCRLGGRMWSKCVCPQGLEKPEPQSAHVDEYRESQAARDEAYLRGHGNAGGYVEGDIERARRLERAANESAASAPARLRVDKESWTTSELVEHLGHPDEAMKIRRGGSTSMVIDSVAVESNRRLTIGRSGRGEILVQVNGHRYYVYFEPTQKSFVPDASDEL